MLPILYRNPGFDAFRHAALRKSRSLPKKLWKGDLSYRFSIPFLLLFDCWLARPTNPDFAWISTLPEALEKLVKRRYVFHCSPRGQGAGNRDFDVVNTPERPLNAGYMPGWVPPSLRSVYEVWNGIRLFEPEAGSGDGFRLFELDICAVQLRLLRKIFAARRDWYLESSSIEQDELDRWLDGLVPIAEIMASGDVFALDTSNRCADGECPVYFLDHEFYYGGCCDPENMDMVATNVVTLLEAVLEEPLKFVASHWTGGDPHEQWYPDSCTISE